MATLTFVHDLSRDPMNPDDLALKIATQFSLTTPPTVDIDPTSIIVTHPQASEAQRAAVQAILDTYVLDPLRASYPSGNAGTLLYKAHQALDANATFLAIGSPTQAQTLAQVQRLTRETSAVLKLLLGEVSDISGT